MSSERQKDHLVDVENTTPTPPRSPTGSDSDAELYPVEKLCKERYDEDGKRWFKVKWEGTTKKSWEPVENVAACLVEEFERKKKRKLRKKMEETSGNVGGNSGKVGDGSSSDDMVLIDYIKTEVDLPQFPCDFKGCVKVFVSLSSLKQHKTKVHFPKVVKEPSKKTVVKDSGKRKGDVCKTKHKKSHTTVTSIKERSVILGTPPTTVAEDKLVESSDDMDVFGSEGNSGTGTNFSSQDSTPIIIDVVDENEAAASESPTEGCFPETQVTEAEDLPLTAATVNTVESSDLSLSLVISSDSETEQGQMNISDTCSSEPSNEPTTPAKKRKVSERDDQDQLMDIRHIKVESEVSEDVKPTTDALYNDWKRTENQYLDKLKNECEEWKRLYEMEKKSRVKNERDFKEKLTEFNNLKADLSRERSARLAEAAKVQDLECKLKEEQNKIQELKTTLGEALGKL